MSNSSLESLFEFQIKALKLPIPEREHKFHPKRKWRFDFAFVERKIAVEIEGGLFVNGRHNRAKGMIADMEKYNQATAMGWRVFRFDAEAVKSGEAVNFLEEILKI